MSPPPLTTKQVIEAVRGYRRDEIVLATMTALIAWAKQPLQPLDLPVVGAMGAASSIGLGLALARPEKRVWVLDGDGSLLMQLGTLATIGAAAPKNLVHLVVANGVYGFTGGQSLPLARPADLPAAARAFGYRVGLRVHSQDGLAKDLQLALGATGPVFIELVVERPKESGFDASALPSMSERGMVLRSALLAKPAEAKR